MTGLEAQLNPLVFIQILKASENLSVFLRLRRKADGNKIHSALDAIGLPYQDSFKRLQSANEGMDTWAGIRHIENRLELMYWV